MKFRRAALGLLAAAALAARAGGEERPVRIGVLTEKRSVTLAPGGYRAFAKDRAETIVWKTPAEAMAAGNGLRVGGREYGPEFALEAERGGPVVVDGRPYRGRIVLVRDKSGTLTVINELDLDDYVKGILPHEVSPEWPAEALKAQAVISRTYALANRGRHASARYDLCAQVHCQVYGGAASEKESTNEAVKETRGLALFWNGKAVTAVFHSCCGGRTEDSEAVWEGPPVPYLKSVKCRWCRNSPRYAWSAEVPLSAASTKFRAAGHAIGEIKALKVLSRSKSGRAHEVRVIGGKSSVVLRGNPFRALLDGRVVRSTLWTALSQKRGAWRFDGRGWGHGVGLCQWGAKGLADGGRSFKDILRFYYRDVKLGKLP